MTVGNGSGRTDFYVYAWRRPNGEPFYIGKGRGRRATSTYRRNHIFTNIVAKMRASGAEPIVDHVADGLTEKDAYRLEVSLIAKYGRIKDGGLLANMTGGGEGATDVSPEVRAKMSAYQRSRPPTAYYKGVCFHKKNGNWIAKIYLAGKIKNLGSFASEKDAARAYDIAASAAWGAGNCYLNFPDEIDDPAPRGSGYSQVNRMAGPRTGKFKGVSQLVLTGKWIAQIRVSGKLRHLGRFDTPEEAARAYDATALSEWGSNCYFNFPDELDGGELNICTPIRSKAPTTTTTTTI